MIYFESVINAFLILISINLNITVILNYIEAKHHKYFNTPDIVIFNFGSKFTFTPTVVFSKANNNTRCYGFCNSLGGIKRLTNIKSQFW